MVDEAINRGGIDGGAESNRSTCIELEKCGDQEQDEMSNARGSFLQGAEGDRRPIGLSLTC